MNRKILGLILICFMTCKPTYCVTEACTTLSIMTGISGGISAIMCIAGYIAKKRYLRYANDNNTPEERAQFIAHNAQYGKFTNPIECAITFAILSPIFAGISGLASLGICLKNI